MDCKNVREDMLDALYGEAGDLARRRLEAHHAECAACRTEFQAFGEVRGTLSEWKVPELLRAPPKAARSRRLFYGLAAAASLLLCLGAALRLSGASLEYQHGPVTLRLGGSAELPAALRAQEARHHRDIEELRVSLEKAAAQNAAQAASQEAMLENVRHMLREDERRQAAAWEARFAGFEQRTEAQRRLDLARVSAGLSFLDGKTGQHVARTTELMGYMLRASQEK